MCDCIFSGFLDTKSLFDIFNLSDGEIEYAGMDVLLELCYSGNWLISDLIPKKIRNTFYQNLTQKLTQKLNQKSTQKIDPQNWSKTLTQKIDQKFFKFFIFWASFLHSIIWLQNFSEISNFRIFRN